MVTVTGVLRRLGPFGRKLAWNREFRLGPSFSGSRSPNSIALVERYGGGKRIVELGCGDGSLARTLGNVGFASYIGYDISDEAVRQASDAALPNQLFAVESMEDWNPTGPLDLLVLEETINYLSPAEQRRLMARTFAAMPDDGRIIVITHSETKHAATLQNVRATGTIVEEFKEGDRVYLVLGPPSKSATAD
jgi:cyclopropane fatty-acyl-phospholipid synthase-like methyltransferase